MDFARPSALWLLLLIPPMALWMARGRRRKQAAWKSLGREDQPPGSGSVAWLAALACLVIALGGPRWGRVPGSELPPGHDVVFLIDVSLSMAARDAVPDRLGLAVESARTLLDALGQERGSRVAIVAFAGRGVLRCPLTANLGAASEVLSRLRPGDVRPAGSDLGAGLIAAIEAFDPAHEAEPLEGRTILVLSDGEDHESNWEAMLPALEAARVIVHAVAIGDDQRGHPIPIARDGSEAATLVWNGEEIHTRRQDATMRRLAEATGGAFIPLGLSRPEPLADLYRRVIAPEARRERSETRTLERTERYRLPLLAAVVLMNLGFWPPRRRALMVVLVALIGLTGAGQPSDPVPSLPASDTRGISSELRPSASTRTVREAIRLGLALHAIGDLSGALRAFEHAINLDPRSALARYNAAAVLYAMGRYTEAADRYLQARPLADPALRTKIDYALGNTAVALGDFDAAIAAYDDCLASTVRGATLDAVRRDAEVNRAFAARFREADRSSNTGTSPSHEPSRPDSGDNDEADRERSSPGDQSDDSPRPDAETTRPTEGQSASQESTGPSTEPPPVTTTMTDSPRVRLDRALENARQSRRSRLGDVNDMPPIDPGRKPW